MAATADDFEFYESESDLLPINQLSNQAGIPKPVTRPTTQMSEPRPRRSNNNSKMHAILHAEHLNSDGEEGHTSQPTKKRPRRKRGTTTRRVRTKSNDIATSGHAEDTDANDSDFGTSASESDSCSSDSEMDVDGEASIDNQEIADMLPTKSFPKTKRSQKATIEEVDNGVNDSQRSSAPLHGGIIEEIATNPAPQVNAPKKKPSPKKNPIYHFYEVVDRGADGTRGETGDKHYKCFHGARKVITIKQSMRSNLSTLVNNLKAASPPMHRFYESLKGRDQGISAEEIKIATDKNYDPTKLKSYIATLEGTSHNIRSAFDRQAEATNEPFEQEKFEVLLAEWMVACDQPFDEVEKPEFQRLMEYIHHRPDLKIPHRDSVRRRIMKMGQESIDDTRRMFQEDVEGKVSLSLDAWTSSNNYAFLAIVAHYINKDGKLEELLIDFRELIGEHSGENMAEAVWETVKMYGLEGRILALMLDNATNNDTLVQGLVARAKKEGFFFNPAWARLRCLPHTIHLSAVKLLEGLGILSGTESQKATSRRSNYQDSATTPLDQLHDNLAAGQEDEDDEDELNDNPSLSIIPAVANLRKIIRAIRSSPQRKQAWFTEVENSPRWKEVPLEDRQHALMLILDVKTRWSSTHQMLSRALLFSDEIDSYCGRIKELRNYELVTTDWEAVKQVTSWLSLFRAATVAMSQTKQPMLSTTHAIFKGLQEHLRDIIASLPQSISPALKKGLVDAHLKLSTYYGRSDQSPFYTWAAILDPRIMFKGLEEDCNGNADLLSHLNTSRSQLQQFFDQQYAVKSSTPTPTPTASTSRLPDLNNSPRKIKFTSRYAKKDRASVNELEEFFKLEPEDFDACNPLEWWRGRRSQFPKLYCLACDILAIPGSAVAVERIFSGGRDTISLRRASLRPQTIRILMLLKQRLRLARVLSAKRDR